MVRTRFAPSPTGYMHLGNIRSALYTYLIAKKDNGTFVLRIEDTDRNRYVEGAIDKIYSDLAYLGFNWDEGPDIGGDFGPYIQSERREIYHKYVNRLLESGHAYYCFCSEERLENLREEYTKKGLNFMYDGLCKGVSMEEAKKRMEAGEKPVIRFKMPKVGTTSYHDEIFGELTFANSELDDIVLIKSDGYPTYNFANVVDDTEMKITHVVRGNEYISSTPKYKLIYDALGLPMPTVVHLPMVNKPDGSGKKLGKRDGDVTLDQYIEKGYLKEAVINFISLLGWSPGGEEEIFTLEELVSRFHIKGISKSPAVYDQNKLNWMNGIYIRKEPIEEITTLSVPYFVKEGLLTEKEAEERMEWLKMVVEAVRKNVITLSEIPEHAKIFFGDSVVIEEEAKEVLEPESAKTVIKAFCDKVKTNEITEEFGKTVFKEIQTETGIKGKELYMPIRVALTGQCHGPEMLEILMILGKENMLKRAER